MSEGEAGLEGMVPASEAAYLLADYRESIVRKIQRQELAGALVDGKWYVQKSEIDAYQARMQKAVDKIRADAEERRAAAKKDLADREKAIGRMSATHRDETPPGLRHLSATREAPK